MKNAKRVIIPVVIVLVVLLALNSCKDTLGAVIDQATGKADTVQDDSWMILTAKLNFKFNKAYGRKGPVLSYVSHELCEAPEQPVATFY